MSKELMPLKAFERIKIGSCEGKYKDYCDIIETALNDYEEIKKKWEGLMMK